MAKQTTEYYDRTASAYDDLHGGDQNYEHVRSLERSWPLLQKLEPGSVVDVGCGTCRALEWFHQHMPSLRLVGIDPSEKLLEKAREKLPTADLLLGFGERLPLPDDSTDVAVATGIMHHVDDPAKVIHELFRVARKAVLISDHNNFAFGGTRMRKLRLWLYASGLLGMATFVKQGLQRQGYSEDDGWWYPYSLMNNYGIIARLSSAQYLIPTREVNSSDLDNFLLNQSHFAILALKAIPFNEA